LRSFEDIEDEFGGIVTNSGGDLGSTAAYVLTNCFNEPDDECPGAHGPWLDSEGDIDGVFGGLQAGYDWQWNRFVFGVVGDASVSGISGYVSQSPGDADGYITVDNDGLGGTDFDFEPIAPANLKMDLDWLATLRLRAGWLVTPDLLAYIHGGLAVGEISVLGVGEGPFQTVGASDTATGYTIGAGAEWRLDERYSIFAEYSFVDLGDVDFDWSERPGSYKAEVDELHLIKAGFNIRFNGFGG
jgi:outer membrane immunogenic protein